MNDEGEERREKKVVKKKRRVEDNDCDDGVGELNVTAARENRGRDKGGERGEEKGGDKKGLKEKDGWKRKRNHGLEKGPVNDIVEGERQEWVTEENVSSGTGKCRYPTGYRPVTVEDSLEDGEGEQMNEEW